jgi:hypothetical protein
VFADAPAPSLFPVPTLVIMGTAFAVVLPFFFLGNPSGHDFEFHVLSWMEVVHQWRHGTWYPRWAEFAHWGYGEARFLFYPPISWNLGALLGMLVPWKMAPGAYVWVVLTASGCSMFVLARRYLPRNSALFAAVFYAANPYYFVIVYWRSALAELFAGCLLPLLLLWVLRAEKEGAGVIAPLSLVVAAGWLANAPSAVMINYSLALLIVVSAIALRNPRLLAYGAAAIVLGLGLASFYVLPAAHEEKWVNIAEVLAPGLRPQDNFLFTTIADADHNRFNLLVSLVGVSEVVWLLAAIGLTRRWSRQNRVAWWTLTAWGVASALVLLPFTLILWRYLPELRFVQLPWRWLLCLNVPVAMLSAVALRRWFGRAVLGLAALVLIWVVWHRVQPPWWDTAADIQEMRDFVEDGDGYEGTDEYVPAGVDPSDVNKDAPKVTLLSGLPALVKIEKWEAGEKIFSVKSDRPDQVRLRLFNYPAWRVEVNGRAVVATSQAGTGEIVFRMAAGENRVRVRFIRTEDRWLGLVISAASVLMLFGWVAYRKAKAFTTEYTKGHEGKSS